MNIQSQYIARLSEKKKRIDGRQPDELRRLEIIPAFIEKAEGSARVRIGNTDIIAGIKMDVGTPFPDKPDEGILMVPAERPPLASPKFEPGPPKEEAIELARVVDRGIRESHAIDLKKLCISPEKCWKVSVDLMVVNHDGNLIDAASLASLVALKNAQVPEFDGKRVNNAVKTKDKVPLIDEPLAITVWKVGSSLLVDPTREEEDASIARLTVSTKKDGNICAIQKGGSDAFTWEEIETAFDLSITKGAEVRKLLK